MAKQNEHKDAPLEIAFVLVLILVAPIVAILGIDALMHFVFWAPYKEFPWFELRIGAAIGFVLCLVMGTMFASIG